MAPKGEDKVKKEKKEKKLEENGGTKKVKKDGEKKEKKEKDSDKKKEKDPTKKGSKEVKKDKESSKKSSKQEEKAAPVPRQPPRWAASALPRSSSPLLLSPHAGCFNLDVYAYNIRPKQPTPACPGHFLGKCHVNLL